MAFEWDWNRQKEIAAHHCDDGFQFPDAVLTTSEEEGEESTERESQVTQILPTPTPFYSSLMEIRQSERNAEKKLGKILMMADIKRETMHAGVEVGSIAE